MVGVGHGGIVEVSADNGGIVAGLRIFQYPVYLIGAPDKSPAYLFVNFLQVAGYLLSIPGVTAGESFYKGGKGDVIGFQVVVVYTQDTAVMIYIRIDGKIGTAGKTQFSAGDYREFADDQIPEQSSVAQGKQMIIAVFIVFEQSVYLLSGYYIDFLKTGDIRIAVLYAPYNGFPTGIAGNAFAGRKHSHVVAFDFHPDAFVRGGMVASEFEE